MAEPTLNSINVTLWEKELMTGMHEQCFVKEVCTPPTDVNGSKAIFSKVDAGTWDDYQVNGNIVWSNVGATSVEMPFDKQKYFAKKLDKVEAKKINDHKLIAAVVAEHKGVFADVLNKYYLDTVVAAIPLDGKITGAQDGVIVVTANDVYTYISKLVEMADKKKVPQMDRFLYISPGILRLLRTSKEITKDYEVMANGFLNNIRVCGCNVIVCADMPKDFEIILAQKRGVGYGEQLSPEDIELIDKLQSTFGTGVRALTSYGLKVLRDDSIFAIKSKAE